MEPAVAGPFALTVARRGEPGQPIHLEAEFTGPIPPAEPRQEELTVAISTPSGRHVLRISVTILPATYR